MSISIYEFVMGSLEIIERKQNIKLHAMIFIFKKKIDRNAITISSHFKISKQKIESRTFGKKKKRNLFQESMHYLQRIYK